MKNGKIALYEDLKKLNDLHDAKAIPQDEYEKEKAKLEKQIADIDKNVKSGKKFTSGCLVFLGVCILISGFTTFYSNNDPEIITTEKNSQICYAWKEIIKSKLKAPSTAEIGGNCIRDIISGSGNYMWGTTVDSQNSFGAMIRSSVICKSDGEKEGDCVIIDR